jgi:acyl-CoA hydrolase
MDARPAAASQVTLIEWMGVDDANTAGFVHGGTVMKLCDEAAGIAAIKHSRCRVVTAAMDRMTFLTPVHVGELLTLKAAVNAVWRTSMEVGVRVESENPRTGEVRHTNTAYLTMVAVDDDGRPLGVPPLQVSSPEEQRRERESQVRRTNSLAEREQIRADRAAKGE